jgi:multiple sugar transport system permease protein
MASIAGSPDARVKPNSSHKDKAGTLARREARWGYFFIAPFLIGFFAFTLLPTLAALIMSFTDYKLGGGAWNFVGVQNYVHLANDPQVWSSLGVTLRYGLIALPVAILFPLGLAVLLNTKQLWGKNLFRTLFYFPYIVPFVAAIFVWGALLNPETGWINQGLRALGVANPPNWVNDTTWVYPALVILGIWGVGNAMLIFLASLQGVPTELYDASKIDGAGWWATMRNVTLPLISPVIFYNLTLAIVGLFQYFTVPLVLNQGTGAPGGATMFYNLYLYKQFFTYQNMAYGATMAWLLFAIVLAVTLLMFGTQKYWVYYTADNR